MQNKDIEHAATSGSIDEYRENGFESIELKDREPPTWKIMSKIDLHILPTITGIYIMAFLDRINVGNALIYKLPQDLKLHGEQINICLSIFFVSYVVFQIPATILMKKLRPHVFLSVSMFLFGLLVLVQGLVQNYGGLVTTRFLMGIAESGVFSGCFYLMSMWYKRWEAQKRFTFFFSGASFAGAFGGLLASAIGKMDGIRGYSAWRWIFILEGLLTCVLSFVAFFTVADFPEDVRWLTAGERDHVLARLKADQGASGIEKAVTFRDVLRALSDWRVFLGAPLYFSLAVSAYGLAYFIPSIISTYGYSPIQAQLHSVIPWAAAVALSLIMAYVSDKLQKRFVIIAISLVFAIVGNIMLFTIHTNREAEFAGVVFYLMGVISALPIVVCWYAMNLKGHQERAVGIPWQLGVGNASGIVSTFAFPSKDAPRYVLGYSLGIGFLGLGVVVAVSYYTGCMLKNRRLGHQRFLL